MFLGLIDIRVYGYASAFINLSICHVTLLHACHTMSRVDAVLYKILLSRKFDDFFLL